VGSNSSLIILIYDYEEDDKMNKFTLLEIIESHPFIANKDEVKQMIEKHFEYVEGLEEDSDWLSCLESAGVDNWSGYDYAREMYNDGEDE
jgi:hypothetical protein